MPPSRLLQSLASVTSAHPHARKRVVGPDADYGRELLRQLARDTGGWIGWESCTVGGIACELAFVPLSERNERIASDVEIGALVNEALDAAIEAGEIAGGFADLARGLGFRRTLRESLLHARTGGVTPAMLRDAATRTGSADGARHDPSALAMAATLERYERLLTDRGVADQARVLKVALAQFDTEAPFTLDGVTTLAPSIPLRGLPGELVSRMLAHGAIVLDVDMPLGADAPHTLVASRRSATDAAPGSLLAAVMTPVLPADAVTGIDGTLATVDLFAAATPGEEVREVLRRAVAEGLSWDDIEIVATDTAVYGIALDALCTRLNVSATMSKGLPLARTRLGRAMERWFEWIDGGLPADTLRQALEAGEIGLEEADVSPARLASELRRLALGWGRARYERAAERLASGELLPQEPGEEESAEEFAERMAPRRATHEALAMLLRRLLDALPPVPERGSDVTVRVSVNALARATSAYLSLVETRGPVESQTMGRLQEQLAELAAIPQPETTFGNALAALQESLAGFGAWPLVTSDRKPWSSAGGAIHLTDVQHAGVTGRKRVFVVGLDAERARGGTMQDPLLPDRVRTAIGEGRMSTSAELRESHEWRLGAALAGLRGRVTLSYATSAALDGREAGPAPLLLQAFRLSKGDRTLSFRDLRKALLPPVSAVPATPQGMLDARDVWFEALTDGPLVLDGSAQTRESFAPLAAGLAARDAAMGATATAYHGLVPDAGPALDPLADPDREISPSSLEKLAACPTAWFYRYGLKLYLPNDPQYDEETWLGSLDRGSLLHGVYEAFCNAYLGRQDEILGDPAAAELNAIVERELARYRDLVPPPNEMVYEREADAVRVDARVFLDLEREALRASPGARWTHVEFPFGRQYDGTVPRAAGTFTLGVGAGIRIAGRADRIDTLADGTLRVIDYKTGSSSRYESTGGKRGAFDGGRQLQPALYAAAVSDVMGTTVSSFEYRFPTTRAKNAVVTYGTADFMKARGIVDSLLGQARQGQFVSTNDASDCTYCDYAGICRATSGGWGKSDSPRAAWAAQHGATLELYAPMRSRRSPSVVVADPSDMASAPSKEIA